MRGFLRGLVLVLLAVAALGYVGDWAVYKLRGSPNAKVMISNFASAPLKNNKQEIDYLGSEEIVCSMTLFPQEGHSPCWYLRRHTNRVSNY